MVVAELSDGTHRGRGESVPYARYGETPDGIVAAIEAFRPALRQGLDRDALQRPCPPVQPVMHSIVLTGTLTPGKQGRRVYELAGIARRGRWLPPYDLARLAGGDGGSCGARGLAARCSRSNLAAATTTASGIAAVRRAAPRADIVVDANEGWNADNFEQHLAACADAGVKLIEQPLPEGHDDALARIKRPIPVCADESVHDRASLEALFGKYDAVNIKLDKAGGLTEALALAAEAEQRGFAVMVGCMVATSLSMAPADAAGPACALGRSGRSAPSHQGSPGRSVV